MPESMREDVKPPALAEMLNPSVTAFWHGIGTVSLPHTDGDENFMCVYRGYKNFTLVSPWHSKYVYPGGTRPKMHGENEDLAMPHNYSPVNFDSPDLDRYPEFSKAKVYHV
jgi:hypothetical protein